MARIKSLQVTKWEKFVCRMFDVAYISGVAALWFMVWYMAATTL